MKRLLLVVAGLLLLIFLTIICYENKVKDIKNIILNSVNTSLKDAQLDFAKASLIGEKLKTTRIVALSGVAPSLEKKEEAIKVAKNSFVVWDVKDFMTIKKVEKPKVEHKIKPKKEVVKEQNKKELLSELDFIDKSLKDKNKQNDMILQPQIKEQKAIDCQSKFKELLSKNRIHFESSKAIIKEDSFELLSDLAKAIKECPGFKIEIAGYTDSDGDEDYNLVLSAKRADAIKNYLVTKEGIDPNILESRGYGEANPIADNKSDEGKSKNRRIEFNILGEE